MTGAEPYRRLQYKEIKGKKMAYIDEGRGDAIVFQHGNPTSSYLWRNIMRHCAGLGRLIACDLIGMGDSDKLPDSGPARYTYAEQRDYLFALWDRLALGNRIVFVNHDWGSVLAFDWANQNRSRVAGIAYMEGIVTPMTWNDWPENARRAFQGFRSEGGEEMILNKELPRGRDFYPQPDGELLHLQNWIDAIRNGRQPSAPISAGVSAASAAHLANEAYRRG